MNCIIAIVSTAGVPARLPKPQATADERSRFTLYREANDRIVRDAPWVFMWHRSDNYIVQKRVRDFRTYPIYSIDKGMDVAVI